LHEQPLSALLGQIPLSRDGAADAGRSEHLVGHPEHFRVRVI
jgi:hypothetical protein